MLFRRSLRLGLATLLVVSGLSAAAEEGEPSEDKTGFTRPGWYISSGGNFTPLDSGSLSHPVEGQGETGFSGPGANLRVGYRFSNRLGVEFEASWFQHDNIGRNDFVRLEGDIEGGLAFGAKGGVVPGDVLEISGTVTERRAKIFRAPRGADPLTLTGECSGGGLFPHMANGAADRAWLNRIFFNGVITEVDYYMCGPLPTYWVNLSDQVVTDKDGFSFPLNDLLRDPTCDGCETPNDSTRVTAEFAPGLSWGISGPAKAAYFFDGDTIGPGRNIRVVPNNDHLFVNPKADSICRIPDTTSPSDPSFNPILAELDQDCRRLAIHPKSVDARAFFPADEEVRVRSDTFGFTVNLKGYPSYNGLPAVLGPFSNMVSESTLKQLSLGGRLQPFAMLGAGLGITKVDVHLVRKDNRDLGFNKAERDIGAIPFCEFVDKFGYTNPYGAACIPGLHSSPIGGLVSSETFSEVSANVLLKAGVGFDLYATKNLAVSVEGRAVWLEGFGAVPIDLSMGLLYRFF